VHTCVVCTLINNRLRSLDRSTDRWICYNYPRLCSPNNWSYF